ncbi:MAG: hypothetical protein JWO60_2654, partial [Frankiales bacterium]|nr:hypothetical protein [Frankiales bacterium]
EAAAERRAAATSCCRRSDATVGVPGRPGSTGGADTGGREGVRRRTIRVITLSTTL